jgi:heme-degrading monooxygenase HmoA
MSNVKKLILLLASVMLMNAEVYELRTYVAPEGKIEALHARFRDHTLKLFTKHGMENVMYWKSLKEPNTLIYVLKHKSREAAEKSWDAFRKDPEWIKAKAESEKNGALTSSVTSVFMESTDYSPKK